MDKPSVQNQNLPSDSPPLSPGKTNPKKKSIIDKPLLLWVGLWICGQLIIGIRNDLVNQGKLSSIVEIIIASLFINVILIPLSLIAWLIMKLVLKAIKKPQILSGEKALRNVLIIWSMLFLIIFLYGFFNKNLQSRNQTLKTQPTLQVLESTEDWIKASINGLEFKYPPDYQLQKKGDHQFTAINQRINIYIDLTEDSAKYETWLSEVKEELGEYDKTAQYQVIGDYGVYSHAIMSGEGIFEKKYLTFHGYRLVMLTIEADTQIIGNEEPKIYEEIEQLANQIIKTYEFGTRVEDRVISSTEDWLTYSNTKYHYSLKHPKDIMAVWGKEALSGDETEEEKNPATTDILWFKTTYDLLLQISVDKTDKTLEQIEKSLITQDPRIHDITYFQLNNQSALQYKIDQGTYIELVNNGYKYHLFKSGKEPLIEDQILSTFKFLE